MTITADPLSNGWFFAGWAGELAGVISSTCQLRADRHLAVQAIYGPPRRFTRSSCTVTWASTGTPHA